MVGMGAASEDMMADASGFLIFGLAWLGFGAFMVAKPHAVLRSTQWRWTQLPRRGTRLLGTIVLAGAAWWFYPLRRETSSITGVYKAGTGPPNWAADSFLSGFLTQDTRSPRQFG